MAATITGRPGGIARHRPPVKATARTVATGNRTVETFYRTVDATDRTADAIHRTENTVHRATDAVHRAVNAIHRAENVIRRAENVIRRAENAIHRAGKSFLRTKNLKKFAKIAKNALFFPQTTAGRRWVGKIRELAAVPVAPERAATEVVFS